MQVRVLLQITADDGEPGSVEEIATWDKTATAAEDIGISLAEGKTLLSAAQRRIVEAQTTAWVEYRRCCDDCGRRAIVKGRHPIVYQRRVENRQARRHVRQGTNKPGFRRIRGADR